MSRAPLPMFPLGTVVFPFTAVALRVFEPRYLALLEQVESGRNETFGTVLIERGSEVGGGDDRFDRGTRLRLASASPAAGIRSIVVAGVERIGVDEWLPDDPHPWARVSAWPDEDEPIGELLEAAHARLARVMALASELGADTAGVDLDTSGDPVVGSYQLSALVPVTPIDSYRLLTAPGPRARLRLAVDLLDERIEIIQGRLRDR